MIEPRRLLWSCLVCEHPVAAVSMATMKDAAEDHAAYVNRFADRATDPHFQESRHDLLLGSVLELMSPVTLR